MERMNWLPFLVLVKGPNTSIAILSLGSSGVSVITGVSFGLILVSFSVWQVSHLFMNSSTSFGILFHWWFSWILLSVRWIPKCSTVSLWFSFGICVISSLEYSFGGCLQKLIFVIGCLLAMNWIISCRWISLIAVMSSSFIPMFKLVFLFSLNSCSILYNHVFSSNSPSVSVFSCKYSGRLFFSRTVCPLVGFSFQCLYSS